MRLTAAFIAGVLLVSLHATAALSDEQELSRPVLKAAKTVTLAGGPGNFDWMTVDPAHDCLLAGHKGKGTLEVFDLEHEQLKSSLGVGECQGVAYSAEQYFAGDAEECKVVFVDAINLKIVGELKVPGEIDAIAYNPKNDRLYVDHDDGSEVWVIDVKKMKLAKTIDVAGVPEYVQVSENGSRIYQNVKTANSVAVIDGQTDTVISSWSTMPAEKPHGLALDEKHRRLYSAGGNGALVAIDLLSGKVVSSVTIAKGVDQIALDPDLNRIYCACREKNGAVISVVDCATETLRLLQNLPVASGTHTLTVDAKRHAVWTSYADKNNSYLQRFDSQQQ